MIINNNKIVQQQSSPEPIPDPPQPQPQSNNIKSKQQQLFPPLPQPPQCPPLFIPKNIYIFPPVDLSKIYVINFLLSTSSYLIIN